ncbi:Immunoglobulin I-set, partial [Trinorchestia longiramus]
IILSRKEISPSFVTGHYDRSGPQHRITWGRGNSHSAAVFSMRPQNVTAVVEHKARLPCAVRNLGLKDVSWIRQRDLHILTVATYTYTTDDRFKVFHQPGTEQWDLVISSVTFRDAGVYECQVSTSPKASLPITLHVLGVQEAQIAGPKELYIQTGSTISISCTVSAGADIVGNTRWLHGSLTLN